MNLPLALCDLPSAMALIPPFSFSRHGVEVWTTSGAGTLWTVLMGFLVATACGWVGVYLILRRMALVGDAISHSVLPGIAVAFLLSQSRGAASMFMGALAAGVLTTLIIEFIQRKTRVKQDAAIGIAFTTLFAIGVILISSYASHVDLDQECVLYGEIAFVPLETFVEWQGMILGPPSVVRMGIVALLTLVLTGLFYKELLVSSFDAGLASSLGINATWIHYGLMCWLAVVVVSAFEAVGAILVIAMLVFPGGTAMLLSSRLPAVFLLATVHAALSSVLGIHLAAWLDCSTAGAMVVAGSFLFVLAWLFSPSQGMLRKWFFSKSSDRPEPEELPSSVASPDR